MFIPEVARFRMNVFYEQDRLCIVARRIPLGIKTFDELGLPPVMDNDEPKHVATVNKILENGLQKSTVTDNMVSAAYYFNFSGSYNLPAWKGHKLQTFVSINNLLDKKPPSAPATSSTRHSPESTAMARPSERSSCSIGV